MTARRLLAAAAGTALIALAGCGGGGSRLSAADYRAQATKICTESDKKTNQLKTPTKAEEIKPYLQKGIDITKSSVAEFKKLKPPKDLQSEHDAAVKAEEDALNRLQQLTDSLNGTKSDAAAVQKVSPELDRISTDVNRKLRAAGLPRCAQ